MDLFRDDYRSLRLGNTYYYRVIAKNESGSSSPSNVISVKHTQANQAPVVALAETLTTSQDQGVQLSASWRDDALPDRNVTVNWSNGGSAQAHFCATDKAETRAWFSAPVNTR